MIYICLLARRLAYPARCFKRKGVRMGKKIDGGGARRRGEK